tara:strand:- start:4122 stop:4784 length:663 start_codon:yes stop_codon:yes gene_type:complete
MSFQQEGFEIFRSALSDETITRLRLILSGLSGAGTRGVCRIPEVRALAESETIRDLLPSPRLKLVRSILFDKSPEANWPVAIHQDRTISVSERREVPGYGPWTLKDGIPHVEPPSAILEGMATIRLHLDNTPEENGALWVIPGSHRDGKLDGNALENAKMTPPICLECQSGDAVLMRPLILHSSKRSASPQHRRVLHFEFADLDSLDSRLALELQLVTHL